MGLNLGATPVAALRLGNAAVSKVMLGANQVWPEAPPPGGPDPDAQAWIARMEAADGQALEPAVSSAMNQFVVDLKNGGFWDSVKIAYLNVGARTLAGALVPLVDGGGGNLVATNLTIADYSRTTGIALDALRSLRQANNAPIAIGSAFYAFAGMYFSGARVTGRSWAGDFEYVSTTAPADSLQTFYTNTGNPITIQGIAAPPSVTLATYQLPDMGAPGVLITSPLSSTTTLTTYNGVADANQPESQPVGVDSPVNTANHRLGNGVRNNTNNRISGTMVLSRNLTQQSEHAALSAVINTYRTALLAALP